MGYKQGAEEQIEAFQITRINGQPTDEDIDKLVNELTECAATIPTTNGGGSHGHMGMLIEDAKYCTFSTNGEPFTVPTNPGAYPLNPSSGAITRGAKLQNTNWKLALILASVKSTGEYDNAIREWYNKPTADKTFANFHPFITIEFTKRNKSQNTAKNAGFGIANAATALQEQQIQQLQLNQAAESALAYAALAKAMKDSQKESMENMMKMFKDILGALPPAAGNGTPATNGQRPKCPHCNRRHIKPEECWELEANASKRPANWKPAAEHKKKDT
eukprot:CCRYP_013002-RA/>CCRYP_013002-RA protein AED:0.40 eAED:0.39 QI:0/0/0/1/1/1/2/0/274